MTDTDAEVERLADEFDRARVLLEMERSEAKERKEARIRSWEAGREARAEVESKRRAIEHDGLGFYGSQMYNSKEE